MATTMAVTPAESILMVMVSTMMTITMIAIMMALTAYDKVVAMAGTRTNWQQ